MPRALLNAPFLAPFLASGLALSAPVAAQTELLATRTLRASQVIGPDDLAPGREPARPGFVADPAEAVGMEARVTLYIGRPIPLASLAPAALVERNQLVTLVFRRAGLEIRAEGRALGRAGPDEAIRVLNLASRTAVTGRAIGPGLVSVN